MKKPLPTTILLSIFWIFLSFNWHLEELINHAERLEKLASFPEAAQLYQLALEENKDQNNVLLDWQLRYKLSLMHFFDEKIPLALKDLEEIPTLPPYFLPLKAHLYRQLNQLEEAKDLFMLYLSGETNERLEEFSRYSLGELFFQERDLHRAAEAMTSLVEKPHSTYFYCAQMLMSKIEWLQGLAEKALQRLDRINDTPPANLLKAEIYSSIGNYAKALEHYQRIYSVQLKHCNLGIDHHEIQYRIGWIYFLQDPASPEAQMHFESLVHLSDERAVLPLAEIYLKQAEIHHDLLLMRKGEELIKKFADQLPLSLQPPAQIIQAKSIPLYYARDAIYRTLTSLSVQHHPWLFRAWLEKGIHDFNEAKLPGNKEKQEEHLQRAILAFQSAEQSTTHSKIEAITWKAHAYLTYETSEKDEKAYQLLTEAVERYGKQLAPIPQAAELYYLLAHTENRSNIPERKKHAIDSWMALINTYPQSSYVPSAFFSIGTYYYMNGEFLLAQELFSEMIEKHPKDERVPEALYFISLCEEKSGRSWQSLRAKRQAIWTKYPESQYAPDAYYYTYPFALYIKKDPEALIHLEQMSRLYPRSPLAIHANYLMALSSLDLLKKEKAELLNAIDFFNKAEALYQSMKIEGRIPIEEIPYYSALHFQIILRKGWTYLAIAQKASGAKKKIYLEYGADTFETLIKESSEQSEAQHVIQEEALFALAQTYILSQNTDKAEEIFDQLIKQLHEHRITRGYYLSRTLFEKAMIAKQRNDNLSAIHYFQQAEDAAQGRILSGEQRIELWIEWGLSQMELQKCDEALWLFSRAVNDHVISELRLKAMFLRSEIYSMQGREEVAIRQLQSLAKMEGEWAKKAQDKLRNSHD